MKVKELIKQLSKLENQNAKVNIMIGDDELDLGSYYEFELFEDRTKEIGIIEIFCHTDNDACLQNNKQLEE